MVGAPRYRLLRNATALLEYGGLRVLIDPALDAAGARPPIANTANQRPNPLVELPAGWQESVASADVVLQTHLHRDHFDYTAVALLSPTLTMVAQPEDVERLSGFGFRHVIAVEDEARIEGITIRRTSAQHGTGVIAEAMAPVSGFVLSAAGQPTVYLASDTIWYPQVAEVIRESAPEVIVLNAGGARFLEGDPIVMTAADIAAVHALAPDATLVIQHLEAINHCEETRAYYRQVLPRLGVNMARIAISEDGEIVELGPSD